MDRDVDVIRIVEGRGAAIEGGVIEVPFRRRELPDELRMYEFKIDLDGDAVEDVTYRLTFDPRDAQGKQRFVLRRIRGADARR
jgi:hypothetical protein